METIIKKVSVSFTVSFLLGFMTLIFGPAEIFFANVSEFEFLYEEFAGYMALIFVVMLVMATIFLSLLPEKFYRIVLSVPFAVSVAGYIQIMFLNKNLDLLGLNPDGYHISLRGVQNLLIWLVILIGVVVLAVMKKQLWKKVVLYLSLLLIGMQTVALVSLLVTAPKDAYERPKQADHLSGKDQYTVSSEKNIIVFVLDYFSSLYLQQMLAVYPDGANCLHDFTYYNNADCTYFGTFPSMEHMLTGCEVDTTVPLSEWCQNSWNNDLTVDFYQEMRDNNYKINLYTGEDVNVLCVGSGCEIMRDRISNITDEAGIEKINTRLLIRTLCKMSAYRMLPELLKAPFYTNVSEYSEVVKSVEWIPHTNGDFYEKLKQSGLQADSSANYFIIQHLLGTHEFNTDEYGNYQEKTSVEQTARGCMTIMEAYLNELKRLGVYDDATIIITADHGGDGKEELQVIYFIKQPGETHDASPITNAPIAHCDILPTVAQMAGIDHTKYGKSVLDFKQDEKRERTMWVRERDPNYSEMVYYGYTYTGDIRDLIMQVEKGPTVIKEMYEAYPW